MSSIRSSASDTFTIERDQIDGPVRYLINDEPVSEAEYTERYAPVQAEMLQRHHDQLSAAHERHKTRSVNGSMFPEASFVVDGQRIWWCGHTEPA